MKIYRTQNVYDAALKRIRWIFDEFPNVVASVSGGKDSTVIFHLCLQVAREKGRLPLKVFWLDQEAEWQATVDIVTEWMYHPDVDPLWMQFPFRLFNATSASEHWLDCWAENKKDIWVHPQVEISKKENKYGTDRFHELFEAISVKEFGNIKSCFVAGVRAEESPTRYMSLTYSPKYKYITWAKTLDKKRQHFTLYPLYDWSYTDIWKVIFDNGWAYNSIYDSLYRYGVPPMKLRVSNVHHETAVHDLFRMQEIEPETYEKLVRRIAGIDMAGKMGKADYFVTELPFMFLTWREYRDYLLEHLIEKPEWKKAFNHWFTRFDTTLGDKMEESIYKGQINAILCNDFEGVKLGNLWRAPTTHHAREERKGAKGTWI